VKRRTKSKVCDRLRAACDALESIDRARHLSGDRDFGRALEDRLVRRELFDLELQELDEQFARVCESATMLESTLPPSDPSKVKSA